MGDDERVAVEQRTINVQFNGVWKDIPAIHRTWVTERAFPRYLPPPAPPMPLGARETWLEMIEHLHEDLQWLLTLPHHVFWSQVIYSKAVLASLTSFLQEAPPSYCCRSLPDPGMDSALRTISRLVFLVYCRFSISRESPQHFFTNKAYADAIYDHYIFTVPSMLDLCTVYGTSNKDRVTKILRNVTTAQPKYLHDLSLTRNHLIKVLERARDMLSTGSWATNAQDVKDVTLHVYDALVTLRIFLQLCPKSCDVFTTPEFASSAATFYSAVIPNLVKCEEHLTTVQSMRGECVKIARTLFEDLMARTVETQAPELVERHLALVSEILSEGVFVLDYHAVYPLDVDLDVIANVCPDLDHDKIDYLLEALSSHLDVAPLRSKAAPVPDGIVNYPHNSLTDGAAVAAGGSAAVSGVELESLITQVQDILPHLGSGFVEACLRHYDFSAELVIAAVLESTLPPCLEESQWDKKKSPVKAPENVAEEGEFAAGYRGKKPRSHRNLTQLLNDKREVDAMRDRFDSLRLVEDTVYDDDYDDTYETEEVTVVREPDDVRRPFVTPRVLQQGRRPRVEEDDDQDEDDEEEVENGPKRDMFIQNPEELRARAEQRRAAQQRTRDVVGRAKGQGQDKQVLINRANKQVHKGASGNHHRRDRASRKRNQGMIPS